MLTHNFSSRRQDSATGEVSGFRIRRCQMNQNPILFLVAFLLTSVPINVFAQPPAQLPPVQHNHVVSTNLLGVVAKWFNIEYERKATDTYSAGLSASDLMIDDMGDGGIRR